MINKLSSNTNKEVLQKLIEIHKKCISKTNSQFYEQEQINEWLSTIKLENIQDQLNNTTWIVIKNNNEILGFAQYSLEDKELYQIQINPDEQGKGYGRELYNYIENDFRINKIKQISLFATLNAVKFYEKLGFRVMKEIKFKLLKTKIKMIKMSKELV
ncbi:MAG TPA: GNAT family N-acetyltransferase [Candidatus Paceibacterota bacterium]|jgi:ribosomal protein S18 acetylase RimI-like enzyme|nr:GNAT family N-acetyltransferase [Candidatus Paceibacterota bacterium]